MFLSKIYTVKCMLVITKRLDRYIRQNRRKLLLFRAKLNTASEPPGSRRLDLLGLDRSNVRKVLTWMYPSLIDVMSVTV